MKLWMLAAAIAVLLFGGSVYLITRGGAPANDPTATTRGVRAPGEVGPSASDAARSAARAGPGQADAAGSRGGSESPGGPRAGSGEGVSDATRTATDEESQVVSSGSDAVGGDPTSGRVVVLALDPSGAPRRDVRVSLIAGGRKLSATTGPEGEAVFQGIPGGSCQLSVSGAGLPELVTARPFRLSAGATRELTLQVGEPRLAIAGRVLSGDGRPLPGIQVQAARYLFQVTDTDLVPRDQTHQTAVSDDAGRYRIEALLDGDYQVEVVSREGLASASRVARAGVETCDLIVDELELVTIRGDVISVTGDAVGGVTVFPVGQPAGRTQTGPDGTYSLDLSTSDRREKYVIRFSRVGYRDVIASIAFRDLSETDAYELNVELEPIGETAAVTGVVKEARTGAPLASETVFLQSPSLQARYAATTDATGRFALRDVQIGEDYRIWVHPRGAYSDFSRHPVAVASGGLDVAIELEALGTGNVRGVLVGQGGAPLGDFSWWLRSSKAQGRWIRFTTDPQGRFDLEAVPEGALIFDTRSLPRLRAHAGELRAGGNEELRIVLDWGTEELGGLVTDPAGAPVVRVRVELYGNLQDDGIRTSSYRQVVSDSGGRFRFAQLGPGSHQLRLTREGFETHQSMHEVGGGTGEVRVELKPVAPPGSK